MKANEFRPDPGKSTAKIDATTPWSTSELNFFLKSRVYDAVKKINTGIIMELSLSFVLCILGTFFFLLDKTLNIPLLVVFYVICFCSIVFYAIKLRHISGIQLEGNDFKTALTRLVHVMNGYLKTYAYGRLLLVILFPFAFALPRVHADDSMAAIALTWGIGVILSLVVFLGIKSYVDKLYGNYCKELNKCLEEIKD